jgi:hypothetical protein
MPGLFPEKRVLKMKHFQIYESDSDGDNKLTKEEILNKYDLFVGSQVSV